MPQPGDPDNIDPGDSPAPRNGNRLPKWDYRMARHEHDAAVDAVSKRGWGSLSSVIRDQLLLIVEETKDLEARGMLPYQRPPREGE